MIEEYNLYVPNDVKTLLDTLKKSGYESYTVGGCVRDNIIKNREINDWDICTNALPHQVLEVFECYRVIKTGLQHGTVTVILNNSNYEITTYRIDGEYKDNRRPETVNFVRDLAEDLKRRDFTINALAYNPEDGLMDYNGGILDIQQKLIKCVGIPYDRFNEDALRILRGLRFAAVLGFSIEKETEKAMFELKDNLFNISNERIMVEFSKLITGINATEILRKYREIIAVFIPEITLMFEFKQNNPHHKYNVWEHTLKAVEFIPTSHENSLILRLSAFLHDTGKPATYTQDENGIGHFYKHAKLSKDITINILTRLKYSKDTINQVSLLVENHDRHLDAKRKDILRFLNKFSLNFLDNHLCLKEADVKAQGNFLEDKLENITQVREITINLINENTCYKPSQLKITGNDLIQLGIPQGKELGRILSILMTEVIDEVLENDKDILIQRTKELL